MNVAPVIKQSSQRSSDLFSSQIIQKIVITATTSGGVLFSRRCPFQHRKTLNFGPSWLFCQEFTSFGCPFYIPKQCGGASKLTNIRYVKNNGSKVVMTDPLPRLPPPPLCLALSTFSTITQIQILKQIQAFSIKQISSFHQVAQSYHRKVEGALDQLPSAPEY